MSMHHDLAFALALGATMPEPSRDEAGRQESAAAPPAAAAATPRRFSLTRNGKIARLPKAVREELNRRLEDGAQGRALVGWLNGLPEVKAVMKDAFGGRAVTEQNLSEWRQGGFLDWQRQQEARDWVLRAAEEAEELGEAAGAAPLTDVLGASITLLLSRLIREAGEGLESTREQRQDLILLIRQWCALRQGDHRAAKLKMQRQDWADRRARAEAAREKWERDQSAAAQRSQNRAIQFVGQAALQSLASGLPEDAAHQMRAVFGASRAEDPVSEARAEADPPAVVQPGPFQADPTESNRIAPKKLAQRRQAPRAAGKLPSRKARSLRPSRQHSHQARKSSP